MTIKIKHTPTYFGIILLIIANSCQNNKYVKVYYPNGKIKAKIQLDKNNMLNGVHEEYYESGELKLRSISDNGKLNDTVYEYDKKGFLREKGLMTKGLKNSWWSSFDENHNKISDIEYIIKNDDTIIENQIINYDSKMNIDFKSSWFFRVNTRDTVKLGYNSGEIEYYSNFKTGEDQLLYAVIKKDTFYAQEYKTTIPIVFFADKKGDFIINGNIFEEILITKKVNNEDIILSYDRYSKRFTKKMFVLDSTGNGSNW